ncbi:hypothetical protein GCL60_16650 [Silvanigrella paludirubra]|uniref:Uncharacterized protein n=1 Tax=Silvanigrella paludirubra TaxID=2499159 RepID=A0A6N6VST4_9BACT|nr:hypothetical protein [Silvanigrella paludirubra]KAB8035859.1 hypothetical protein GCL60_16650 [Silvanigrella paludirubra]
MKKIFIIPLLLSPSLLFASNKIDFNLFPTDRGGNSDAATFSNEKIRNNPSNFIGKTATTALLNCISSELVGKDLKNVNISYDGVICRYNDVSFGVIMDLKQRELVKHNKIKIVTGTIVGVNLSGNNTIIIQPEKIN